MTGTTTDAGRPQDVSPDAPARRRSGPLAALRELVVVVLAALVISFLVKTFLLAVFWVPSESMEDTLLIGDRVVVSKLTPGPFSLHRGDVVVFTDPGGWLPGDGTEGEAPVVHRGPVSGAVVKVLTVAGVLPDDSHGHLVKRVVGLPGDTVSCTAGGRTTVNGHPIRESWLATGAEPCGDLAFSTRVPAGHVWVEGDNRQDSRDSRYHQSEAAGGSVPERLVVGRAVARVWPLDRIGRLSGHHDAYAGVSSAQRS